MFLRQTTDAFLVRTDPASSIVNPAHIHITSAPHTRNEKVFRTNRVSSSTAGQRPAPACMVEPYFSPLLRFECTDGQTDPRWP